MERTKQTALSVIVIFAALAAAAALIVGGVSLLRLLWQMFVSLPQEVAVAIVAASATVFAAALAVVIGQYLQRRASILQDLRQANAPMYEKWAALWFRIMLSDKVGRTPSTEQEVIGELAAFTEQLLLWGSDRVLREWVALRIGFVESSALEGPAAAAAAKQNLIKFARFMKAIRRDMGHRNWRVTDVTVLGLWINDAHKPIGAKAEAQSALT